MKKILVVFFVSVSWFCHAQIPHPLRLLSDSNTCNSMTAQKCFDNNNHSLLLKSSCDHNYYRLNDLTGEISPIPIDTNAYEPISFYTEDSLFLWSKQNSNYLFYDIRRAAASEVSKLDANSILKVLPQGRFDRMSFNQALTECIFWDDTCVLRVKFVEKEQHLRIDTLLLTPETCPITYVFRISNSTYVFNRFNIPTMEEFSSLLDAKQNIIIDKYSFLIDDCLNKHCLAWKDGKCYICQFDSNTLELINSIPISAFCGLYGRIGFLSESTIAWYTGMDLDYNTFEPLMNQQDLLIIEN